MFAKTFSKTCAINTLAGLALLLTPTSVNAQSFDYPAGSPSIFNRGQERPQIENISAASPAAAMKQNPTKPALFSKLISRKRKSTQPSFASPYPQHPKPQAQAYDTMSTAYIHPAEENPNPQTLNPISNIKGYQPLNQQRQAERVNFDNYANRTPQSILEKANDSTPDDDASPVARFVSTQQKKTAATRLPEAPAEIAPESITKIARRVSLPRDAFQQEFDKAYRYINPTPAQQVDSPTRIAQADEALGEAPGELNLDDFPAPRRRRSFEGDFSPENPLKIETPEFIRPQPTEQSPNASEPDFIAPRIDDRIDDSTNDPMNARIDGLPTAPVAKPSTTAPWDAQPQTPPDVATTADGFSDDFGNLEDWQPPEPSKSLQSLEDELEELSKPFKISPPPPATSNATSPYLNNPDAINQWSPQQDSPIWWKPQVAQPLHPENLALPINSNGLVFAALQNSPRIQAVSKNPLIRELQVVEADAEFDPVRFVRSQFQDRVDPVGNSLTIGQNSNEQFLKDNIWTAEAGVRRKLRTGADFTVSQQLGFQNSNSNNFTPQDQGTATLALNVTQPLLRGRGRVYNQAQILIAQSTGGVAWEVFQKELQEELEGVVSAYWQLYLDRSIYLQRKRNVERGQVILDRLNGRRDLDSLPAQVARAKSSVQTRKTELANAFRNIRNAETEIRRRVADRNWMASQSLELLPAELPTIENTGWELDQVVQTALNHRPEIRESMRRIKIAGVQRDVSENELLPELSFLVGTYVSALQGDSDVLGAFGDQFGGVTPGYSFGLEYELPRRNRAARSRFQQRHLQFKRLQNELEEVIQNVIAESQIALRRIDSAIETLAAAEEAIVAARADLNQNEIRWESFALVEGDIAEGVTPTTILDQLLDSQERLSQAEIVYAQAELELKVAEVALQRSMGTLLMHQQVSYDRDVISDTPVVRLSKAELDTTKGPIEPDATLPISTDKVYTNAQPIEVK